MDFATQPKRRPAEAILPMINVVFLLLIFFLMTARIAPRAPFELRPPETTLETLGEGTDTLFLSADGVLFHGGLEEAEIWVVLADHDGPLTLRADAGLSAVTFAQVLGRLNEIGIERVDLSMVPR